MYKYSTSCTDVPYQGGTVNYVTKNETTKTAVAPYQASMMNHATMNKIAKINTETISVWHVQWTPSMADRNYTFGYNDARIHV